MDLSIPSNVHENVKNLEHVKVVNLDTLSQITNKTLEERKKHLPHAEEILREIEAEFSQWLHDRQYAPTLRALKAKLTAQQTAEIKARERKQNLPEEATLVSDQMIQKITGQLANFLKENPTKASDALNIFKDVFQLDPSHHE